MPSILHAIHELKKINQVDRDVDSVRQRLPLDDVFPHRLPSVLDDCSYTFMRKNGVILAICGLCKRFHHAMSSVFARIVKLWDVKLLEVELASAFAVKLELASAFVVEKLP